MNKSLQDEIKASYLKKNAYNLAKDTLENLRMAAILSLFINAVFTVGILNFLMNDTMIILGFIYLYLLFIVTALYSNHALKYNRIHVKHTYGYVLIFLSLMSIGLIYMTVYLDNNIIPLFLILFLVMYPTLFLLKNLDLVLFITLSGAVFIVAHGIFTKQSNDVFVLNTFIIFLSQLIGIPINLMVIKLRRKELYLKELFIAYSHLDELTKLPNRRAFNLHIEEVFNDNKNNQIPLGVALIDIDDFKIYNDAYGHLEGDNVLEQLGYIIQNHVNPNAFFARFGGEEFIGVFTNQTNEQIQTCLSNICQDIVNSKIINQETKHEVTVSIGFHNETNLSKTTYMKVIDYADIALYKAKIYGKNRIEMYTEE